jgi:Protein-tyrosine phosphatase
MIGNMTAWPANAPGVVTFPDGTRVRGRGLRNSHGLDDAPLPQFGIYLSGKPHREVDWECRWVRWPDFRLPRSTGEAVDALREVHGRARTERVEVACGGGTGRTGTALALLAVLAGVPADGAVGWVRSQYRGGAVETPWQRRWVAINGAALQLPHD